MVGAPSQVDTFDPKPALEKYNGQPLARQLRHDREPVHQGRHAAARVPGNSKNTDSAAAKCRRFFLNIAECVDDLCFVRSFYTDSTVHAPAMYQVNTGRILMGYPSMGSWITYGLGSESENLPAYVVMPQPEGTPEGGTPCWGAGFLPAVYQGTVFRSGAKSDPQPPAAGGHDARTPAAHTRFPAEDERDGYARTATRKWRRASVPTNSRSACRAMRPKPWIYPRKPRRPRRLYGVDREAHQRIRHALPAGAAVWSSAASDSSSFIPAADQSQCNGMLIRTWSAITRKCAA